MQNQHDRRFFVLSEARKGNYETACAVNKETKLLQIRKENEKGATASSNSKN